MNCKVGTRYVFIADQDMDRGVARVSAAVLRKLAKRNSLVRIRRQIAAARWRDAVAVKAFIRHRRDDSASHASRVNDRLQREFGPSLLFMDVDGIPLGSVGGNVGGSTINTGGCQGRRANPR